MPARKATTKKSAEMAKVVITKKPAVEGPLVGREQEYEEIREPLVSSLKSSLGCCICTTNFLTLL